MDKVLSTIAVDRGLAGIIGVVVGALVAGGLTLLRDLLHAKSDARVAKYVFLFEMDDARAIAQEAKRSKKWPHCPVERRVSLSSLRTELVTRAHSYCGVIACPAMWLVYLREADRQDAVGSRRPVER